MTSRIGKLLCETTGASQFAHAQQLREQDVVLIISDSTDVMLARSAAALTLRCFMGRTIVRGVDGRPVTPALASEFEQEAAEYGASARLSIGGDGGGLSLGLGCATDGLFVDARGWSVSVNQLTGGHRPATPAAAAFAAAAGVAKLFAHVVGRNAAVLQERWTAPLLDFPPGDDVAEAGAIDLGRVVIVGAGAIGSGLAHILRGSRWRGDLVLVDDQRYDEPNHETTLLISQGMAMRQAWKASTLADRFRSSLLAVRAYPERVIPGHPLLSEPAAAIVCAVDNVAARQCLDDVAAPVVFNAGVGGSRDDAGHVLWTRHERHEPPLSVHYPTRPPRADADAIGPADIVTDACSRIAYASVSLAAPFMGLAAGALLAAGLAQRALGVVAPTNYMKFDLLGLQRWPTRRSLAGTRTPPA